MENFFISDLIATSAAFCLFALFLFVPGYVSGWLLDVFEFRRRSLRARLAMSTPLSIGVCPILTYLLWRWSLAAVWTMYAACWIAFLALLVHDRRLWLSRPKISKTVGISFAIVAGWVVVGMLCLVDMQIGDRLYFPVVAHDYTLRAAITSAISRTGIPPSTPYFFPGRRFILRYHYFWFMLCSLVEQMGRSFVTARQAMIAGTLWSGIGLMALVPLYLRFFQAKGPANIERRTLVGVALLGITGLDIVPAVFLALLNGRVLASIEWWNDSPVMSWTHAVFWVPHNVAGLVSCLGGFLVIWRAPRVRSATDRVFGAIMAGLMFASAVGLSIFVTFVFVVFAAIWLALMILKKHRLEAAVMCAAAIPALAASSPYLLELRGGFPGTSNLSGSFLHFTVRSFRIPDAVVETLWPDHAWLLPITNLLLLPLNYFLELGFFFVVAIVQWKRMRSDKGYLNHKDLCGFTMAASSILLCTFLRSSILEFNDLGRRGFMAAQFILLVWGAELWDEGLLTPHAMVRAFPENELLGNIQQPLIAVLLFLGLVGSLYEACMMRLYPVISDDFAVSRYQWLSSDRSLGRRTYALRQVYEYLKKRLPERAVVQQDPNAIPGDLFYGLYADRQTAAETSRCDVVFGLDPALCGGSIGPITDLFEKPGAVEPSHVDGICRNLSIDALVVKDTDKVWADKNSWVWKKQPILANSYARAFLCGRGTAK